MLLSKIHLLDGIGNSPFHNTLKEKNQNRNKKLTLQKLWL